MENKKNRRRIPQEAMVRSMLQQEVGSQCPLCPNADVGHFEIHHIDEDPSNNDKSNLLLLCRTCHSKITKGVIKHEQVRHAKDNAHNKVAAIEVANVAIDPICGWKSHNRPYAFYNPHIGTEDFPVINFSLINHTLRTVLFQEILLKVYYMPSGLSGIPKARILRPLARYQISLPEEEVPRRFVLPDEIEVPASAAFKFQVELFSEGMNQEKYQVSGRLVLQFSFTFHGGRAVTCPEICLNCEYRDQPMRIYMLS
jgi:HNH endonuclease